jgi:hypothetical protein
MSEKIKLGTTTLLMRKQGKGRLGQVNRAGYVDSDGQVYAPPKSAKRQSAWMKKMAEKGYEF